MFIIHNKKHHMKTRSNSKFKITHAKTARFKRSSIPYMEELLNKEHEVVVSRLKTPTHGTLV